jgi:hypothetical protein
MIYQKLSHISKFPFQIRNKSGSRKYHSKEVNLMQH